MSKMQVVTFREVNFFINEPKEKSTPGPQIVCNNSHLRSKRQLVTIDKQDTREEFWGVLSKFYQIMCHENHGGSVTKVNAYESANECSSAWKRGQASIRNNYQNYQKEEEI